MGIPLGTRKYQLPVAQQVTRDRARTGSERSTEGVGLGSYRATVLRMEELGEPHEPFWLVIVLAVIVMLSALAGIALLLMG